MNPAPIDIKSVRVAREFKHEAQLFRARSVSYTHLTLPTKA